MSYLGLSNQEICFIKVLSNQEKCLIYILGPVHMHKIYTCKYFAIWSKYTHVSKSIFNLRSHANSVHISILKVTLDQLYFDSSHVQTVS